MRHFPISLFVALSFIMAGSPFVQAQQKVEQDSIRQTAEKGEDRNIMLNAESANAGPRNVNIGLPASVGGTTVLENGLPVVFFYWPELPYKAWRMDATINRTELLNLGQTAINVGDVGFSMSTYDNLGTNKFQGVVALNSNHYGLLNGSANFSGPLSKKGLKFSVGAFLNYDPGTYSVKRNDIDRYFSDQTQLYKAALTQDYTFGKGKGSISLFYKYMNTQSAGSNQGSPYVYHLDGSVSELDGFKIGNDNYIMGQKFTVQDAATGRIVERDILKDYGTTSHTLDLIGKNVFDNGLNFNYILRYHSAKTGHYAPVMTGISADTGLQDMLILGSRRTPTKSFISLFELSGKSDKHSWKVGINEWLHNINGFVTEGVIYSETVEANPQLIAGSERYGYTEYHNGTENQTALFLSDTWKPNNRFTVNGGIRLEYISLRGDYINNADVVADRPYLSAPRTNIHKNWFRKSLMVDAVYTITKRFGLLGEVSYNEQYGHLENYSAGNDPDIKRSSVPSGGIGVFYNHPWFSLVSKATYISRNEYRATVNFTSASGAVARPTVGYDIQTLGWTTDVMMNPFKNFNLHLLLTLQSPQYRNYSGTIDFNTGETVNYSFNNNTVTGVSKVLVEIDPSYQWKKFRIWGSARYFSKEYANLTNSLYFKGRWETFAGINYKPNDHLEFSATIVNLLNQRGAKGSISGADLYTAEDAQNMEGRILSGTYIRPFTVEFGMKYNF